MGRNNRNKRETGLWCFAIILIAICNWVALLRLHKSQSSWPIVVIVIVILLLLLLLLAALLWFVYRTLHRRRRCHCHSCWTKCAAVVDISCP
jgi:apolipoprotein N-acyltransferase